MDLDLIETIRRIVKKQTPTAEKQSANRDDSSSRFVGTNSLAKLYAKTTPGQGGIVSEKFENEKKALKKEAGSYGKKGKKDQEDKKPIAPEKDDQDDGAETKFAGPADKGAKVEFGASKFPPGEQEPDDDEEASVDTQAQRAIPTGKTKVIINPEMNDPEDDETKTGGVDLSNQPRKKNKIVKEVLTYQLLKVARRNRIIEQLTQGITDTPLPTPTLPDNPRLPNTLPSGRAIGKKFKKKAAPHADNGE